MFIVSRTTIHRTLELCAVAAALIAPGVTAQPSSGTVVFPVVTETNATDCRIAEEPLTGPAGGTVQLRGGQFINRGNTIYVTGAGSFCSNGLTISFSPAATSVTIGLRNFVGSVSDVFLLETTGPSGVTSSQYTVPPLGNVVMSAQGHIGFVSIRSVRTGPPLNFWGFGITSLAITQPPVENSVVTFDAAQGLDDSRILISKASWDIGYPSRFQLPPDSSGNPRVKIAGTLRDRFSGQPKSGTVYLRVDDPPDPAPYRGSDAHSVDNDGAQASIQGSTNASVEADGLGRFETELVVNSRTAGDNFEVVGSADAQFACGGAGCPRTPVFTLWKRIYVEEQRMFRRGAFLNDLAEAATNKIPIADPAPFQGLAAGEMLQLVHAESGSGEGFYFDFVAFQSLQRQPDGTWFITTAPGSPIPRDYGAQPIANPNPLLDVIRDGVGVVSAGTFETNPIHAEPLFASMFVELKPVDGSVTEIPYIAEVPMRGSSVPVFFANRWLQRGVRTTLYGSRPDPNVFHRLAATQAPLVGQPGFCHGAELGATTVGGQSNFSYIFDQRIQAVAAGAVADPIVGCPPVGAEYLHAPVSTLNGETTAHETVHFWVRTARQPDMDGQGHCSRPRYVDTTNCLLHRPFAGPELYDGQVLLHYDLNGAHSEYMWIRRDPDPVPQQ